MTQAELDPFILRERVVGAILKLRDKIQWRPGKDLQHWQTRLKYGHLPESATLADYDTVIRTILAQETAEVHVYIWRQEVYPTIVGDYGGRPWLVMFSPTGIMETAFPPTDPQGYLADPRFRRLGVIQELLS